MNNNEFRGYNVYKNDDMLYPRIITCDECKYAYRDEDGTFNSDDIVCCMWNSDGFTSTDYCSCGELGVYEHDENDITCLDLLKERSYKDKLRTVIFEIEAELKCFERYNDIDNLKEHLRTIIDIYKEE